MPGCSCFKDDRAKVARISAPQPLSIVNISHPKTLENLQMVYNRSTKLKFQQDLSSVNALTEQIAAKTRRIMAAIKEP